MPTPLEILDELVNDPEFDRIVQTLTEQRTAFFDSPLIYPHLNAAANILPRLKNTLSGLVPRQVAEDDPVSTGTEEQQEETPGGEGD